MEDSYIAGTRKGGLKAAITNQARYGADFYARIGSVGGKLGTTGGFWADRELARTAGAKGGTVSRRGKAKPQKVAEEFPWIAEDSALIYTPIIEHKPSLFERLFKRSKT